MNRVLSVLTALVFLLTSAGISLGTHYCGGKIHKQAFFAEYQNLNCGMDDMNQQTPCENSGAALGKNCCRDITQTFKIHDEYQGSHPELTPNGNCAIAFAVSTTLLPAPEKTGFLNYLHYKPPRLTEALFVVLHSFLI